jgi:hypothetical protein
MFRTASPPLFCTLDRSRLFCPSWLLCLLISKPYPVTRQFVLSFSVSILSLCVSLVASLPRPAKPFRTSFDDPVTQCFMSGYYVTLGFIFLSPSMLRLLRVSFGYSVPACNGLSCSFDNTVILYCN